MTSGMRSALRGTLWLLLAVAAVVHGNHEYSTVPANVPEGFPLPEGGLPGIPLLSLVLDGIEEASCLDPAIGCVNHDECVANTGPGSYCQMGYGFDPPYSCQGCDPGTGCCSIVANEDVISSFMGWVPALCRGFDLAQVDTLKCLTVFQQESVEVMLVGMFSMYANDMCALAGLCGTESPFAEQIGGFYSISPVVGDTLKHTFGNVAYQAVGAAARSIGPSLARAAANVEALSEEETCSVCMDSMNMIKNLASANEVKTVLSSLLSTTCTGVGAGFSQICGTMTDVFLEPAVATFSQTDTSVLCSQMELCAASGMPVEASFRVEGIEFEVDGVKVALPPFVIAPTGQGQQALIPGFPLDVTQTTITTTDSGTGQTVDQVVSTIVARELADFGYDLPSVTGWLLPDFDYPGFTPAVKPFEGPPDPSWNPDFAQFAEAISQAAPSVTA